MFILKERLDSKIARKFINYKFILETMHIMVIYKSMASIVDDCEGFDWDSGNSNKNWLTHRVTDAECEEVFFNTPLLVRPDEKHRFNELRHFALGRTDSDRHLFVSFTARRNRLRVISARDMTKSEERKYAEKAKRDSGLSE